MLNGGTAAGRYGRVHLAGIGIDPLTEAQVVAIVQAALDRGAGGRIITPNVDILRQADADPSVRDHFADATLVVADGMPLVWSARLSGTPVPERVAGASLIWSLSRGLEQTGRSVYLLGGAPRIEGTVAQSGARQAAAALAAACPGLRIAGAAAPGYGFDRDPHRYAAVCAEVVEAKPDLVFVGLGFPKQERIIDRLRGDLPFSWFLGCGAAIGFVAGQSARAPQWMQRAGLEWVWRLAGDPRRLTGRYLRHDAPYALRLFASALAGRASTWRSRRSPAP